MEKYRKMEWKKCKWCRIKFKGNICPNCSFKKINKIKRNQNDEHIRV